MVSTLTLEAAVRSILQFMLTPVRYDLGQKKQGNTNFVSHTTTMNLSALSYLLLLVVGMVGGRTVTIIDKPADSSIVNFKVSISTSFDDTLVINLKGNPTTGYSWTRTSSDTEILVPILQGDSEYSFSQSEGQRGLIGAGGTFTFKYKPSRAGNTILELKYYRSWESADTAVQTFTADVTVTEAGAGASTASLVKVKEAAHE